MYDTTLGNCVTDEEYFRIKCARIFVVSCLFMISVHFDQAAKYVLEGWHFNKVYHAKKMRIYYSDSLENKYLVQV